MGVPIMPSRPNFCLGALIALVLSLTAPAASAQPEGSRLREVRSWAFQLQNVDPLEIKLSPYDLVVIDYGFDKRNATAFPREVVELMRKKPDGRRRLILAYLSIGEAENYRYYWQDSWLKQRPEWLEPENPDWPGNYLVRYWHRDWQALLFGKPNAYLDRIIDAGFDGIYVDGVDRFEQWKRRRPSAPADMVDLLGAIASYARELRKEFMIIPQNGDGPRGQSPVHANDRRLRPRGPALQRERAGRAQLPAQHHGLGAQAARGGGRRQAGLRHRIHVEPGAGGVDAAQLGYVGYIGRRDLKGLSPPAFGCGQPDCSR